jgi:hypothetical protein
MATACTCRWVRVEIVAGVETVLLRESGDPLCGFPHGES